MLNEAVIILSNMRGGYADVGTKVPALFRMSIRPSRSNMESDREGAIAESADSILKRLESSR